MHLRASVASALAGEIGRSVCTRLNAASYTRVHGGCINEAYRWESDQGPLFVKIAPASSLAVFEAEAAGLEALGSANAVRVPRALASGVAESAAFLALEWIEFGPSSAAAEKLLGEQLARQHRVMSSAFGWSR